MNPVDPAPKISVIVPTYNTALYLADALHSLLSQTTSDFEVILLDDASIDNTSALVETFLPLFGGRLHYFRLPTNVGRGGIRNFGFAASRGAYVTFLDSDDANCPNRLEVQSNYLDDNLAAAGVSCQYFLTNERLLPLRTEQGEDCILQLLYGTHYSTFIAATVALMLRRKVIADVGGFDSQISRGQDLDFILRILRRHRLDFISEPLFYYRHHEHNSGNYHVNKGRRYSNLRICVKVFEMKPPLPRDAARVFVATFLARHVYMIREREYFAALYTWWLYTAKLSLRLPLLFWSLVGLRTLTGFRTMCFLRHLMSIRPRTEQSQPPTA